MTRSTHLPSPDPAEVRASDLRSLMERHSLTRADVCRLLGIKVRNYSSGTVDGWLSGARNMPAAKLELLKLKLEMQAA